MMKLGLAMLFGLVAVPAALASAPRVQEPVMLNNPNPASFQVYGVQPAPRTIADDGVEGAERCPCR